MRRLLLRIAAAAGALALELVGEHLVERDRKRYQRMLADDPMLN